MSKNVFDLAQEDTSLKLVVRYTPKGNGPEYAGPCPGCGGSDRFHLQPERKEGGLWMCRNCRPAETYGWSDGIEYLRQFRNMSFTAARSFLAGEVDTAIARAERAHNKTLEAYGKPPNQLWQDRAKVYVDQAQGRLWTPEGLPGLDYLRSRALSDRTILDAHLGYALYQGIPCIVIPWFTDGAYWRINLRDIRPDIGKDEKRYHNIPGSSNAGLYLGDSLKFKRPVFMVEGEIDALSIAQEAGELVSVVATGGTSGSRSDKWVVRLAISPSVLVAYDNEPQGNREARWWLHVLEHNAIRYRPVFHKDANAMLVADRELLRVWITSALADPDQDQAQEDTSEPQAAAQEPGFTCSVCGIDLTDIDTACYDAQGLAFCGYDEQHVARCSRAAAATSLTQEQFINLVERIAGDYWGGCTLTFTDKGYTLEQHVARMRDQASSRSSAEPTPVEQEVIDRLKGYGVFLASPCSCGCRLKWRCLGELTCAYCEPGPLWTHKSRSLLEQSCTWYMHV